MHPYGRNGLMAVLVVVGLVFSGCGGGGGVSPSQLNELQAQLDLAEAERAKAEEERKRREAELAAALAAEKAAREAAEAEAAKKAETPTTPPQPPQTLADAALPGLPERPALMPPTTPTTPTDTTGTTGTTGTGTPGTTPGPGVQPPGDGGAGGGRPNTLEANTLSEGLLTALEAIATIDGTSGAVTALETGDPPVTPDVMRGALTISQTGYSGTAYSASPFTGRRLTRTHVGKEDIVLLTDRQAREKLLDRYFTDREGATPPAKRRTARFDVGSTGANFTLTDVTASDSQVTVSHGFPSSYTTTAPDLTKTATSYSGTVLKVGGRFECAGGTDCMVQVVAVYDTTGTPNTLNTVALSATGGGVLYFRPSNPAVTIPLDGSLGGAFVDAEYMTFGWWRTEPTTPDGAYRYQIFYNAAGAAGALPTAPATYSFSGTAVGLYVEQGGTSSDLSKRQGEFRAAVNLTATSTGVSGQIGNFRTTAAGGSTAARTADRWLVSLDSTGADAVGAARIMNMPGSAASVGGWEYDLVGNHAKADPATNPSGVVGAFDTRIPALLHLSGAFGAKRQ